LLSKNGPIWLTIPVARNSVKLQIGEVLLPTTNWRQKHLKVITETYKKSRFFSEIEHLIKKWFIDSLPVDLSSFNQMIITDICNLLNVQTKILNANMFENCNEKIGRIIKILEALGASSYITGPKAVEYLRPYLVKFAEKKISVMVKQYGPYPTYPQAFSPFQDRVSILDLIFNCSSKNIQNFFYSNAYNVILESKQ
jgi:hypothetical protein